MYIHAHIHIIVILCVHVHESIILHIYKHERYSGKSAIIYYHKRGNLDLIVFISHTLECVGRYANSSSTNRGHVYL